jgi:hypothetical protein
MNETTTKPIASGDMREMDLKAVSDTACEYLQQYARERPEMVALWALGIGFVLGWKLKPW